MHSLVKHPENGLNDYETEPKIKKKITLKYSALGKGLNYRYNETIW